MRLEILHYVDAWLDSVIFQNNFPSDRGQNLLNEV